MERLVGLRDGGRISTAATNRAGECAGTDDLAEYLVTARTTAAYKALPPEGMSWRDIPLTRANDVKSRPTDYVVDRPTHGLRVATSGSTGDPTVVYRSLDELKNNARGIASRWAEVLPDGPHRVASLLDHNRSAAGALVEHVMYESHAVLARLMPYTPSGANWSQCAGAMREFAPTVIIGTPGVLLDVEHALRALGAFEQVRDSSATLLTLGATNTPAMRRRLSRSWQASVIDGSFGGTEPGTVATGCRLGNLHSMMGRGVYEVIVDDGEIVPLAPGLRGGLVVTPIIFTGFVLLRYVTGDRIETFACPCGMDGVPLRVLGRGDDRIKAGGAWVGQAEIEQVVFANPSVEDYQLVADNAENLLRVEISVFENPSTAALAAVTAALGVPTTIVESVSPMARTAGVVKSWSRTRVRREVQR